ncbi:MAG: peptide chain release factor N(5)-glutamine methyltransferase [Solirubrobacterales bacterium]
MSPTTASRASVAEALQGASGALAAAGIDTARLDAELLLCQATGWRRTRLATKPEAELPEGAGREFAALVRRRVRREPVAYITGRCSFRHLDLAADRRALVPRPETELLVEVALELEPSRVLDVGTGCGAIALAIADELPGCEVIGTDTSTEALSLARENAGRLKLAGRVGFHAGMLPPEEEFDLLVANLPYVRDGDWDGLAPEIRDYEPRSALVGGSDGLDAIRSLLDSGPDTEAIALEVGEGQAAAVAALVADAGFATVGTRRDLAGIERVVIGR